MNQDYEIIIRKSPEIEQLLNTQIISRVEKLKNDWLSFHRDMFLNSLKKHGIPFSPDPKISLSENAMQIYKHK